MSCREWVMYSDVSTMNSFSLGKLTSTISAPAVFIAEIAVRTTALT